MKAIVIIILASIASQAQTFVSQQGTFLYKDIPKQITFKIKTYSDSVSLYKPGFTYTNRQGEITTLIEWVKIGLPPQYGFGDLWRWKTHVEMWILGKKHINEMYADDWNIDRDLGKTIIWYGQSYEEVK